MPASDWVTQFLMGALFGAVGQGIRVVVGLKKLNDKAVQQGRGFGDLFKPSSVVVSLLIGAIAGVLAVLTAGFDLANVSRDNVMLLVGAGYAGADFIEGFVRKSLPGGGAPATPAAPPPGQPSAPGAPAGPGGAAADEPTPAVG